jgi:hypothetical protein
MGFDDRSADGEAYTEPFSFCGEERPEHVSQFGRFDVARNRELTEQSSCSIVTARGWPGPTSAESHRDTAHSDSAESLENLQLMSQGEHLEVKRGP